MKVLIIEDNKLTRILLTRIFESVYPEYKVNAIASLTDANEKIIHNYDLFLIDLNFNFAV